MKPRCFKVRSMRENNLEIGSRSDLCQIIVFEAVNYQLTAGHSDVFYFYLKCSEIDLK